MAENKSGEIVLKVTAWAVAEVRDAEGNVKE